MRRVTDLIIHLFSKIKVDKLKEGKSRAGACWVISVKGGGRNWLSSDAQLGPVNV